jgi:hypothetical protein
MVFVYDGEKDEATSWNRSCRGASYGAITLAAAGCAKVNPVTHAGTYWEEVHHDATIITVHGEQVSDIVDLRPGWTEVGQRRRKPNGVGYTLPTCYYATSS